MTSQKGPQRSGQVYGLAGYGEGGIGTGFPNGVFLYFKCA
jgi:hypothetical protein